MQKLWRVNGKDGKPKAVLAVSLALALAAPGAAWAQPAGGLPVEATAGGVIAASAGLQENNPQVPLRTAAEALGALVVWNDQEQGVSVSKGETVLAFRIGEDQAEVNGRKIGIGRKAELVNGVTMVPLSFINEAFGLSLGWDGSAVVPDKADLSSLAAVYFYNMLHGNASGIITASSGPLQAAMPEELAAGLSAQLLPMFGGQARQVSSRMEVNAVHSNVTMLYATEAGAAKLEVTLRFNGQGQVDDMKFSTAVDAPAPAYQPAAYDRPELYTEREAVIGEGEFALPGTLTVPKGEGPWPAVILVHGSGPNDRDESIGGAKPFKDLAGGLASRGIAVLRYEKATLEHSVKLSANSKLTLWDETGADALKAVALLKKTEGIDAGRIFIAGHSQGGYALPLILNGSQAGDIKGAMLLSAPSGNMSDVLIEQQQEVLARLQQSKQPAELIGQQTAAVAAYKGMVDLIHNPDYSKDHLPEQFPLGNAYWWFEQRDYQPAKTASLQKTPMLIMQGENDWQVSMKQFNGWKDGLAGRSNVEYKSYPSVNHLLSEYNGLSMGLEYNNPAHVSPKIIDDMEQWVKKQ